MDARRGFYESAEDFYRLGGSVVMKLSAAAAIEVCNTAADRGLLVARIEGGSGPHGPLRPGWTASGMALTRLSIRRARAATMGLPHSSSKKRWVGITPSFLRRHRPQAGDTKRERMRPNSALVSDVCAAALRAFYNAPQRER